LWPASPEPEVVVPAGSLDAPTVDSAVVPVVRGVPVIPGNAVVDAGVAVPDPAPPVGAVPVKGTIKAPPPTPSPAPAIRRPPPVPTPPPPPPSPIVKPTPTLAWDDVPPRERALLLQKRCPKLPCVGDLLARRAVWASLGVAEMSRFTKDLEACRTSCAGH
jgi:hypothetical protein